MSSPFSNIPDLATNKGYVYFADVNGALIGYGIPNDVNNDVFGDVRKLILSDALPRQSMQGSSYPFCILNISAVAGAGLNLNTFTVNGVSIISGAVGLTNADPTASAASVAANINAYVSIPDFRAVSFGGTV